MRHNVRGLINSRWRALLRASDRHFSIFVTAPLITTLAVVALVPFLIMLWYSFSDFSFTLPGHDGAFVGVQNYRRALFDDGRLWGSVRTTCAFIVVTIPFEFTLGLAIALLLNQSRAARTYLVPVMALPALMAPVTVGLVWRLLLHGDYGPIAALLRAVGWLNDGSILGDPSSAFWAIVAIDIWQWTPFAAIVLLAGLQVIPKLPYESAMVDGASDWQMFRDITMPLLRPTMVVVLLFRFMDAFKEFDKIYVLTRGGPASSTEVISIYAWISSFEHGELGYGSAITLLLFIAILISCNIILWATRKEWR